MFLDWLSKKMLIDLTSKIISNFSKIMQVMLAKTN